MLMVELLGSLVRSEMNNSRFANNGSKTFSMIFREVAVPARVCDSPWIRGSRSGTMGAGRSGSFSSTRFSSSKNMSVTW